MQKYVLEYLYVVLVLSQVPGMQAYRCMYDVASTIVQYQSICGVIAFSHLEFHNKKQHGMIAGATVVVVQFLRLSILNVKLRVINCMCI